MLDIDLLRGAIDMLLGGLGALIGAFLLWKLYALPKINRWVFDQGSAKLKTWIEDVIEHPDQEGGQQIGRLAGVAFAYILQGVAEDLQSKEGRERWAPIIETIEQHIRQSIFATYGHLLNKLTQEGEGTGLPGALNVPPFIAGMAQKMMPGVDPGQLLQLVQWLSRMSGGAPGGGPGSSSSYGPTPQPGPSRGGRSNGGVL